MATTDDSNEGRWSIRVSNRSWVDIVDEEEKLNCSGPTSEVSDTNGSLFRDSTNTKPVRDNVIDDEAACDIRLTEESKVVKIQPSDILPNFSVSLTKSSEDILKENSSKAGTSDAHKDFLNEDISLTSHLNGFQLVSPCKVDQKTPTKTPVKTSISHYLNKGNRSGSSSSPSKVTKRKLQTEESAVTDEILMPSPSKMRRQNTPKQSSHGNIPKRMSGTPKQPLTPNFLPYTPTNRINRKRSRELTPKGRSEKKSSRDPETDTEVIARRQKQIDYGKNTVGYDRYRQLVPKEERTKMHPKTPPLQLKFSRRAWDGMIKAWRQRLHFWDPPSEGGGNPDCLVMDEMSDVSSTDGSLPPTPVQDKKRQCWPRRETSARDKDDDEDDDGCTPLPPEKDD